MGNNQQFYKTQEVQLSTRTCKESEMTCLHCRVQLINLRRELEETKNALREALGTDPMTGLASKKRMYKEIEHHLAILSREIASGAKENRAHFSVIFIDIDKFKELNDKDHLLGDRLIIEFADYLRAATRAVDIIGRFGGDEFFILTPQTTREQSEKFCEKIKKGLLSYRFGSSLNSISLSASMGVASTSEGLDEPTLLVGTADRRMAAEKAGKKTGKNG